jgi:hypothetical protein
MMTIARAARITAVLGALFTLVAAPRVELNAQSTAPLIQSLNYVGKFSLPAEFAYGGRGLGFNPARNSLIVTGFMNSPLAAEVSIPSIGGTASYLQKLVDPTEGKSGLVNPGDPNYKVTGGYLVSGSSLVFSVYAFYDGGGTAVASHFVRPLSLTTTGQVTGPVRVGPENPGLYAGYMTWIPSEWRSALGGTALTGQSLISIISRTSYGPAAFAFDPSKMSATGAQPLVYYPEDHQTLGKWGYSSLNVPTQNKFPYVGLGDEIAGVAFPDGTSSVLFFGRHGGTNCYGDGAPCGDPTDQYKGTHGYPYQPVMLVYNANDLAAVHAGRKLPWDVMPVSKWVLPISDPDGSFHMWGTAYDPATRRIYIAQTFAHGTPTVIQVFTAPASGTTTAPSPSAPSNVRIIK